MTMETTICVSWEWDGGNHTNIHKNINSGISQGDIV